MSKRGLSEVITAVLIILLAIVAIVIIWVVVRNVMNKSSEELDTRKITLDLQIMNVQIQDTKLNISIYRDSGQGEYSRMKVVLSDGQNSQSYWINDSLKNLETRAYLLDLNGFNPTKASVYPIFIVDNKEKLGLKSNEKIIGEDKTFQCTDCGDGSDGNLIVSNGQTKYTDADKSRLASNANSGDKIVNLLTQISLSPENELLIINLKGTNAGTYETAKVESVVGTKINLKEGLKNSYTSSEIVYIIKIPQYNFATINSGGILSSDNWDGNKGGVLAFRVKETLTVQSAGKIDMKGKGYRGGIEGTNSYAPAYQGESYTGSQTISRNANYGGGGGGVGGNNIGQCCDSWCGYDCGHPGGGGSYGSEGTEQAPCQYGCTPQWGIKGLLYGTPELIKLYLGSGGGGGAGEDGNYGDLGYGGKGGNGGGLILIFANNIEISGTIDASGANGGDAHDISGGEVTGGGGGAGGSIYIKANSLNAQANTILATGGNGGYGNVGYGGNGGNGRIRIDYTNSISEGITNPSASINKV